AAQVLKNLGCEAKDIRRDIESALPRGVGQRNAGFAFTPRAEKVVRFAREEACAADKAQIDPEDLLIGLLRESEGVAGQVLTYFGLDVESLREEVRKITEG